MSEKEALESTVGDLTQEIERLQCSNTACESALESATQRIVEQDEVQGALSEKEALESTVGVLKLTVEKLQCSYEECKSDLEDAKQRLAEQEAEVQQSKDAFEDLINSYQKLCMVESSLRKQLTETERELAEMKEITRSKKSATDRNLADLEQANFELERKVDFLEDIVQRSEAASQDLIETYQKMCTVESTLQTQLAETERELAVIKEITHSQKVAMEQNLADLEQANFELERKVDFLGEQLNELSKELQLKSTEELTLMAKLTEAERELADVNESAKVQKSTLGRDIDTLQHLNSELTTKVEVLEEQLKETTKKLEGADQAQNQDMQYLVEEAAMLSVHLSRSKDKVAVLERITSKLQEKLCSLERSKADLEKAITERDDLRNEVELLEAYLEKEMTGQAELRKEINSIEAEKTFFENQVRTLTDAHKEELEAARMQMNQMKVMIDASQRMSDSLHREVATIKAMNVELQSKFKPLEQKNNYLTLKLKHITDGQQKVFEAAETQEKQLKSSIQLRQRMMETVDKQMKDAQGKAYIDRWMLVETAEKQKMAIESSFASAAAAIDRLQKVGSRKAEERDDSM